jgi:metallo-beta-lactamase family protein
MKITVLGAGRCVTGSKYLLEWKNFRLLVDCGLFQGPAEYRQLNWKKLPHPPHTIDAVVLTHAHIDHSGYLPRLCRQGFEGPVYCTPPTRALLGVLLPDAAHINEEEARYANKKGYSKHKPALPLFRTADARAALKLLESAAFDHWHEIHPGIRFRYHRQGHILGAAAVELETKVSGGKRKTIYFSGDVGRYGIPILHEPEPYPGSDVLFVESTYGDRSHGNIEPRNLLGDEVRAGIDRGGIIIIPAFAIDRTQEILYLLHELMVDGDLPQIPIYLDSPMGIEATTLYTRYVTEHDTEMQHFFADQVNPIFPPTLQVTPSSSESRKLNSMRGPLKLRLPHEQNSVIFTGYQAVGTKGRRLINGDEEVKIHGEWIPVKAHISRVTGLSAHADAGELLLWLGPASFLRTPERRIRLGLRDP